MIEKDNYIFKRSTSKLKKYDVYNSQGKKICSFGAIKPNGTPYEQFKDKIGLYSSYDHNDNKRRVNYYKRHNKTYNKESADWFSKNYLW